MKYKPRTTGPDGQSIPAHWEKETWIEGEEHNKEYGQFARKGLVRHRKTGELVRVRLDVPDTYFTIPATTAKEYGWVSVIPVEGGCEFQFHPNPTESRRFPIFLSPEAYRKRIRLDYK